LSEKYLCNNMSITIYLQTLDYIRMSPQLMRSCVGYCFKNNLFSSLNQLGRVNELLIKPDLSDLTEEKAEEDVVEESQEEENGSGDCVSTATSIDSALNLVIISRK